MPANKPSESKGAIVTSNVDVIVNWIRSGKPVVLPFGGGRMYGLFGNEDEKTLDILADIKGREKNKPFVLTSHPQYLDSTLEHSGISEDISLKALTKIHDFLELGSKEQSIGVLIPAQRRNLHDLLVGTITVHKNVYDSIGIMMSGPDDDYHRIVRLLDKEAYKLAGTSMNKSGDERSKGSAHHRMSRLLKDFGKDPRLCVYLPRRMNEHKGPSTTLVSIDHDANNAFLIRAGSVNKVDTTKLLKKVGIRNISDAGHGARHVEPYKYTTREVLYSWLHYKKLLMHTRKNRRFILSQ